MTPALAIARARALLGITRWAGRLNVEKLNEAGMLQELPTAGRRRLFRADEVLRAVEGLPSSTPSSVKGDAP